MDTLGVARKGLSPPSMGSQLGPVLAGTISCLCEPHPDVAMAIVELSYPAVPTARAREPRQLLSPRPQGSPIQMCPSHPPPAVPIAAPGISCPAVPSHDTIPDVPTLTLGPLSQLCSLSLQVQMCSWEPRLSHSICFPGPSPLPTNSILQPAPQSSPLTPPRSLPPSRGWF